MMMTILMLFKGDSVVDDDDNMHVDGDDNNEVVGDNIDVY